MPAPSVPDPALNEGSVMGSARAECSPADRAAGPAPLEAWAPPTSPPLPAADLPTQVRHAARQAVTLYAVPPGSADSSDDHTDDNSAAGRTAAASHGRTTRLVGLAGAAVGGREEAVAARAVLAELEQLVRDQPPAHGGQALRYELERIRAGSHELTELDLVDALQVGQLRVPDAHRDPALRVLGGYGVDPRTRLGLPADAHPARLAAAAAAQREHWHRLATHPAATTHLHTVATAATHTCGQLLTTAAAASSGADAPSGARCGPSAPQSAAPVAQPQRPTRGAAPERTES